jgi:hypothetical protein
LAICWCSLQRGNLLWAFIIRRIIVIKALELHLELPFFLPSCFQLSALRCKSSLLLFRFFFSGLSLPLFFLLLNFSLSNLFFQCFQTGLSGFTFSRKLILLTLGFIPGDFN